MSRRDDIKSIFAEQLAAAGAPAPARPAAGPVRTMGLSLEKMEQEPKSLQLALAAGAAVVELDPGLVDASFIADRLPDPDDDEFARLRESMRVNGQEVPILVRPHPGGPGRFQAAYGHRRLRAASELGIKIKAIVRDMADEILVVAQGVENAARRDLSYIERGLFAQNLERRGFDRQLIMQALASEKTELSRLLNTVNAIPEDCIRWIGPAPRTGRRRWMDMAELLKDPVTANLAAAFVRASSPEPGGSDRRFQQVLTMISRAPKKAGGEPWIIPGRPKAGEIRRGADKITIEISEKAAPGFGAFLAAELDALYTRFRPRS